MTRLEMPGRIKLELRERRGHVSQANAFRGRHSLQNADGGGGFQSLAEQSRAERRVGVLRALDSPEQGLQGWSTPKAEDFCTETTRRWVSCR